MFEPSKIKIERAEKHILELIEFVQSAPRVPNYHSVAVEEDPIGWHDPALVITFSKSKQEFLSETAVIIGDVCHNLRSALDYLWYELVSSSGKQTKWTRFPVSDTRQELTVTLNSILEKGQVSREICEFVLDTVKPYRQGNIRIWSLHDMNIIDKHQLLLPTFPIMAVEGIRIRNDEGIIVEMPPIITDSRLKRRLDYFAVGTNISSFGKHPKVQDQGHVSIGQGFNLGTPFAGDPVIPALNAITKEVTRTIEAFEKSLG